MLNLSSTKVSLGKASQFKKIDGMPATWKQVNDLLQKASLVVSCMDEVGGQVKGFLKTVKDD